MPDEPTTPHQNPTPPQPETPEPAPADFAPAYHAEETPVPAVETPQPVADPTNVTPVTAPPAEPEPVVTTKPRGKKLLAAGGGVLAFLVVAGAAAFYWVSHTPAYVASKMFDTMANTKTFTYTAGLKLQSDADTVDMELSGAFDDTNPEQHRDSGALTVKATGELTNDLKVEYRSLEDKFHLKATGLPSDQGINLSVLNDRWLTADLAEFEKRGWIKRENLDAAKLTSEKMEQIKDILRKDQPLKLKDAKSSETVNGHKAHKYAIEFQKEGLKTSIPKLAKLLTNEDVPAEEIESLKQEIDKTTFPTFNVWIGKDHRVYKIEAPIDSSPVKGSFIVTFDKFNQAMNIAAPEKSESMIAVGAAMAPASGPDADKDGLSDDAEGFYGSDPKVADTDKDGHPDGAEVKGGYDPKGSGKLPKEKVLPNMESILGSIFEDDDEPSDDLPIEAEPEPDVPLTSES